MKRAFCIMVTLALAVCVFLVLFPDWQNSIDPEVRTFEIPAIFRDMKLQSFPFYSMIFYLTEAAIDYAGSGGVAPNIGYQVSEMFSMDQLYAFLLVVLISVPVYILLWWMIYRTAFEALDTCFFPVRLLLRGFFAVCTLVATSFIAWLLYERVIPLSNISFTDITDGTLSTANLFPWLQEFLSNGVAYYLTKTTISVIVGIIVVWLLMRSITRSVYGGGVVFAIVLSCVRAFLFPAVILLSYLLSQNLTVTNALVALAVLAGVGLFRTLTKTA